MKAEKKIDPICTERPIFWIVTISVLLTVFYTAIFSHLMEPIATSRPWGISIVGSLTLNWLCLYCEKEGHRFSSYLCGLSGLIPNIIFALSAFSYLLGHESGLYHFVKDPN